MFNSSPWWPGDTVTLQPVLGPAGLLSERKLSGSSRAPRPDFQAELLTEEENEGQRVTGEQNSFTWNDHGIGAKVLVLSHKRIFLFLSPPAEPQHHLLSLTLPR